MPVALVDPESGSAGRPRKVVPVPDRTSRRGEVAMRSTRSWPTEASAGKRAIAETPVHGETSVGVGANDRLPGELVLRNRSTRLFAKPRTARSTFGPVFGSKLSGAMAEGLNRPESVTAGVNRPV